MSSLLIMISQTLKESPAKEIDYLKEREEFILEKKEPLLLYSSNSSGNSDQDARVEIDNNSVSSGMEEYRSTWIGPENYKLLKSI
jgi:hypothetical protein